MAQYSIKDLEKLTGIQAHTIRIWEKRYQLVRPQRTLTNIRVYSDDDVKRLLNVALLNHNGLKISKIAKLNDQEINAGVLDVTSDAYNTDNQIDSLVVAMVELSEKNFDAVLSKLINELGFEETIIRVVYPFLIKTGILWQTGNINPAQEHFVTNIIRRKFFVAIDALGNENKGPKFILYLPEGEYHEIGMLFYCYILKQNGFQPIYLGQSVPFSDLAYVQNAYQAEYILTSFITAMHDFSFREYVVTLSKTYRKLKVFITGSQIFKVELKRVTNVTKVKSPDHFKEIMMKLK
jgi:DNA-binding transcriptional MerR regulator